MNDTEEKKTNEDSCNCGRGKTKWIWMGLSLALGVIVFGKLTNRGPSACCSGGICPLPTTTVASNTGPATAVATGTAVVVVPTAAKLPRLVDLGAGKCIPCKLMAPILEELKSNYVGRLDVQFIDVWQNPDAGQPYQIRMIPTQVFIGTNGNEVFRHEGFFSKEDILTKWTELGVHLK